MAAFDLEQSLIRARQLKARSARARRSDCGKSRLNPAVLAALSELISRQERPRMKDVLAELSARCREMQLEAPSRATVYKLLETLPCATRRKIDLPEAVQAALYNLASESEIPLHQIAFYCFNYGDLRAVSFAAGLPWLALYQARRMRGHRPKSRGLLKAAMRVRRI